MGNIMEITIYTKTDCVYCKKAKKWFESYGVGYTEINLDNDEERYAFYEIWGDEVRTVPQIFFDETRLGGFTDLIESQYAREIMSTSFDQDF